MGPDRRNYDNVGYSVVGTTEFVDEDDDEETTVSATTTGNNHREPQQQQSETTAAAVTNKSSSSSAHAGGRKRASSSLNKSKNSNNAPSCDPVTLAIVFLSVLIVVGLFIVVELRALVNFPPSSSCTIVQEVSSAGLSGTARQFEASFGSWGRMYIKDKSTAVKKSIGAIKARKLHIPTQLEFLDEESSSYAVAVYRDNSMIPVYKCSDNKSPIGYISATSTLANAAYGQTLQFSVYNARRDMIARTNKVRVRETGMFDFSDSKKKDEALEFILQDVANFTNVEDKSINEQKDLSLAFFSRAHSKIYETARWDVTVKSRSQTDNASPIGTFVMFIIAIADYYHLA